MSTLPMIQLKKVLNALIGYWKSVKMEVNTAYIRHINAIR